MKPLLLIIALLFTIYACTKESNSGALGSGENAGKGGSLARFTIAGNYLYVVDGMELLSYNISKPDATKEENRIWVGPSVETIFPFGDKLFIGSRDGMFIYSLNDPATPEKLGEAMHMRSCDPVVANDSVSFVTLKGGSPCGAAPEGLYVYDIKDIQQPVQQAYLPVESPRGLGLKDTVVFVCREAHGLTAVNVKNSMDPKIMYTMENADYKDVIIYENLLICYTSTGLLLYDLADLNHLQAVGNTKY